MLNSQCSIFIRGDSRDFAWFPRLRIEHWELSIGQIRPNLRARTWQRAYSSVAGV
jgi:hypothetical protein